MDEIVILLDSRIPLQMLVSPVLAGLAVAIGVPILLFYVYGVVPGLCAHQIKRNLFVNLIAA